MSRLLRNYLYYEVDDNDLKEFAKLIFEQNHENIIIGTCYENNETRFLTEYCNVRTKLSKFIESLK